MESNEKEEDILALVQEEGLDLTPEQLEMVSGGGAKSNIKTLLKNRRILQSNMN